MTKARSFAADYARRGKAKAIAANNGNPTVPDTLPLTTTQARRITRGSMAAQEADDLHDGRLVDLLRVMLPHLDSTGLLAASADIVASIKTNEVYMPRYVLAMHFELAVILKALHAASVDNHAVITDAALALRACLDDMCNSWYSHFVTQGKGVRSEHIS